MKHGGQSGDFFNTNDFALATGNLGGLTRVPFLWWLGPGVSWEDNEKSFKPDLFGTDFYSYVTNGAAGQKGRFLQSNGTLLHYVTDPHEMMSFVARPRSKAVGAKQGVTGKIGNEVDLTALSGFQGNRDEHSAEFNWSIQRVGGQNGFYNTLLNNLFPSE